MPQLQPIRRALASALLLALTLASSRTAQAQNTWGVIVATTRPTEMQRAIETADHSAAALSATVGGVIPNERAIARVESALSEPFRASPPEIGRRLGQAAEAVLEVARAQVAEFATLVQGLKALTDVDGKSVLDNTLAFFSNEIADGNNHDQVNRPVLLAGSLGRRFPAGKLLDFGREIRQSELFMSLLEGYGVKVTKFGDDGVAPVPELRPA